MDLPGKESPRPGQSGVWLTLHSTASAPGGRALVLRPACVEPCVGLVHRSRTSQPRGDRTAETRGGRGWTHGLDPMSRSLGLTSLMCCGAFCHQPIMPQASLLGTDCPKLAHCPHSLVLPACPAGAWGDTEGWLAPPGKGQWSLAGGILPARCWGISALALRGHAHGSGGGPVSVPRRAGTWRSPSGCSETRAG